jgi:hypothetical protein
MMKTVVSLKRPAAVVPLTPVPSINVTLGMNEEEIRKFVRSDRDHSVGRSYYAFNAGMTVQAPGELRGQLRVFSPHFDTVTGRSVLAGDPPGDLGEIAFCEGFRNGLVVLRLCCGWGSEITREELIDSAQMFSHYLDQCLFQLMSCEAFLNTDDAAVVANYLQLPLDFFRS